VTGCVTGGWYSVYEINAEEKERTPKMGILNIFRSKLKNDPVSFKGGPGDCKGNAVVILAPNCIDGIMAEYKYIENRCGVRNRDWRLIAQFKLSEDGRDYDMLTIETKGRFRKSFYFDITDFFGKF
jgi:hypothetical protein